MKLSKRVTNPRVLYTIEDIRGLIKSLDQDKLIESYNREISTRGELVEKEDIKSVLEDVMNKAYVAGRQSVEIEIQEIQNDYPDYELNDMNWE